MDKVIIYVRRYKAALDFVGGKMVEKSQTTLEQYTEVRSLLNVEDPGTFKQKFIEEMGSKVYNRNRLAEQKAMRTKAKFIEKLIIYNIK